MTKKKKASGNNKKGKPKKERNKSSLDLCPHYERAFNLSSFRKGINTCDSFSCRAKSCDNDKVFVCTQCGQIFCLNTAVPEETHAFEHFSKPRSDCHALFIRLSGDLLFCVDCKGEMDVSGSEKVNACVSLINKAKSKLSTLSSTENSFVPVNHAVVNKENPVKEESHIRSVRGFDNLGNTCFFNSVVQNLMQTRWLWDVLNHIETEYSLVSGCGDELRISQNGELTDSLRQLFITYKNGSNNPFSPRIIFQVMCSKFPMFKSLEQQDAQELFASLINGIYEEDELRVKAAILSKHNVQCTEGENLRSGTSSKTAGKVRVNADTRAEIKREWKAVQHLNPVSAVFGGMLTKYIKCLTCSNIHSKAEPFISLSLSIPTGAVENEATAPRKNKANPSKDKNIVAKRESKRHKALSETKPDEGKLDVSKTDITDDEDEIILGDLFDFDQPSTPPSPPQVSSVSVNSHINKSTTSDMETNSPESSPEKGAASHSASVQSPTTSVDDRVKSINNITQESVDSQDVFVVESSTITSPQNADNSLDISQGDESFIDTEGMCIDNSGGTIACVATAQVVLPLETPNAEFSQNSVTVEKVCSESAPEFMHENRDSFGCGESQKLDLNNNDSVDSGCGTLIDPQDRTQLQSMFVDDAVEETTSSSLHRDSAYASQASLSSGYGGGETTTSLLTPKIDTLHKDAITTSPISTSPVNSSPDVSSDEVVDHMGNSGDYSVDDMADDFGALGLADLFQAEEDSNEETLEDFCDGVNEVERDENVNENESSEEVISCEPNYNNPTEALYLSTLSNCSAKPGDPLSIVTLMQSFTSQELLTGCNKIRCDKCCAVDETSPQQLSNAAVWYRITNAPSIAVLHLKRFAQYGLRLRKVNTFVKIPLVLDLAPFCGSDCTLESRGKYKDHIFYSLYGLVEHTGSLARGHYTAFVKQTIGQPAPTPTDSVQTLLERLKSHKQGSEDMKDGNCASRGDGENKGSQNQSSEDVWYYISDRTVRQTQLSSVLQSTPYMLFYEKMT